jgi:carbohydrate-binding DOMON domain-containing protein
MSKRKNTPAEHHEKLVKGFHDQLKQIFDSSEQAIYLYLDDSHKVCNKKFAEMQGFSSPAEWAKVENPLEVGVDRTSQDAVVSAYRNAMERLVGSKIDVKLEKKAGGTFDASIIMVPVAYQGHIFALHFISVK